MWNNYCVCDLEEGVVKVKMETGGGQEITAVRRGSEMAHAILIKEVIN